MAKYTLANIVEMGKPKSFKQDQAILAGRRIKEKNYSIAKEGLFDFFRKKKEQDDPKEGKKIFQSIETMAAYIAEHKTK